MTFEAGWIQMYVNWNCIFIRQLELKMKESILKSVIEICRVVTFLLLFFSPSVSWSSEDVCCQFCPEHFISKPSYVQLDQKHCLFILPSANKFVFRALLTQLLFSAFLSNSFAFVLAKHGFPPVQPIAEEGRVVLCRTCWMCMRHIMANTELMVINHSIVL